MRSGPTAAPAVEFSTGLYRLLLHAYPARFRRDYGPEMAGVFLDCCLRTVRERGAAGMIELWIITLFDIARSAVEEHARKETGMPNPNFVRLSGWALIVGAVLFVPGAVVSLLWGTRYALSLASSGLAAVGITAQLAPILVAVGLLGLQARYGRETGALGRGALLVGTVAGGVMVIAGVLGQMFARSAAWGDTAWAMWALGWLVMLAGLFVFGIMAVIRRPLPRWNGLPLVAGLLPPLVVVVMAIAGQLPSLTQLYFGSAIAPIILVPGVAITSFALILLGYVLQGDAHQERPAFA